ncbi:hypothetical protein JFZ41_001289 [Escherichia coli]|nr:hypothetical protein [Escherichia coli]
MKDINTLGASTGVLRSAMCAKQEKKPAVIKAESKNKLITLDFTSLDVIDIFMMLTIKINAHPLKRKGEHL